MAVTMRMVRLGRRNRAFFRIRVSDSRTAPTGRFIEEVGFVDPLVSDPEKSVGLNKERIEYWLGKGATVSETVRSLLRKHDVALPAGR